MNFCHLPTSPRGDRYRHAFTLIELLVVITIIAVLAGLLLPVVSKVTQNSYKVQTKAAETQIVASVKNYQTDYGTYPVPSGTTTDYAYTTTNAPLFNALRALNTDFATTGLNTRRVVYFEGNDAKNANQPKAGFVPSPGGGAIGNKGSGATPATVYSGDFLDSWGNEYCIRIDSGYTNAVVNPYTAGDESTLSDDGGTTISSSNQAGYLLLGVVVWSHGADGALGIYGGSKTTLPPGSDDVISWQ